MPRFSHLYEFLLAALVCIMSQSAVADAPDIIWEKHIQYTISGNLTKGLSLSASTTYTEFLQSDRVLERRVFALYEMAGSPISHIRQTVDGRKPEHSFTVTEAADDQDVFLTDDKVHFVAFSGPLKIGDAVSYSYDQKFEDIRYLPLTVLTNKGRMRQTTVVFKHPANVSVKAEVYPTRSPVSFHVNRPSDKETQFLFDSLNEADELPGFAFNSMNGVVQFSIAAEGRPVGVATPEEFLGWYAGKVNLNPTLDSVSQALLDSIGGAATGNLERLQNIHRWVCGEIRYIADDTRRHSYFPHLPEVTLGTHYGDCKDRAYLIRALARRYGIDVDLGLVSTEFEPGLSGLNVALFNHVVCLYHDADSNFVFDPTAFLHPFGSVPDAIVGHPVLVLSPDHPAIDTIRRQSASPDIQVRITASLDSLSQGKAKIELFGDRLASVRYAMQSQTTKPKEQLLALIIGSNLSQINLRRYAIVSNDGTRMVVTADADLSKFLVSSPSHRYVPATPFTLVSSAMMTRAQDSLPIYSDSLLVETMALHLAGKGLRAKEDSCIINDSNRTRFTAHIRSIDSDSVAVDYTAERTVKVFKGVAKSRYLDFCQRYLAAKTSMFVLAEDSR
ncbi:MAG TPA: transglutaminase domain-containing protein [Candidatus Acidoferrum sp.]|nr:transglutaminase domain-containing protein [Candidatus Acidoferrum sp.]